MLIFQAFSSIHCILPHATKTRKSRASSQIVGRKLTASKVFLLLYCILASLMTYGQAEGDYRSAGSGHWSAVASWERFDGVDWQPAAVPPSSTDGVIMIRNAHVITANTAVTADEVIVEAGGTLSNSSTFTIADGPGDDLVVFGTLTNTFIIQGDGDLVINNDFTFSGTIQGTGSFTVNGNTTWTAGTLDRTFTNLVGRTFTLSTTGLKTVSKSIVNAGTILWQNGNITFNVANLSLTNEGTMTISENNNKTLTGTAPFLLTNNATISKAGTGTTTFTNVQLANNAVFNLDEGSLSSTGGSGSMTNTGMISLSGATLHTSNTFNHNAGSMIQGMGNITNSSTWNLNIDLEFPAGLLFGNSGTIQGDGNLVINNDFTFSGTIQGTGSFTVNGNTTWTAGTLDRTFTNPVGRTFTLSTTGLKTVSKSIVNTGTMLWQSGNISFNIANLSLTNEGTMTISENNNKTLTGTAPFLLTNNATISKAGTGTTTFTNVQLVNNATINLDEGTLISSGGSGSITNTGIFSLSGATLQTSNFSPFNHNIGSVIQGTGNVTNSSTWNLNIDLEFPAGLLFGNSGTIQGDGNLVINNDFTFSGTIQGTGSFTVNGNTTWTAGTLDRTFTNPVGRTFTLSTTGLKTVSKSIVNTGTMLWQSGNISFNIANLSLTNEGTMTISENNNKTLTGTAPFLLTNNATITKTGTDNTNFSNVQLVNNAVFNLDEGSLSSTGGSGSMTNTGMISLSGATLHTSNTFNHNAGSMIQGMGNITNSSTWNLNIDLEFPAGLLFGNSGIIQGDGNLVINNDFTFSGTIQGTGSFTVNGNTTWTAGTLDRTFTNPVGRTFTLTTTDLKTVSKSIVNTGTMLWQSGNISFNIANLSLTNEGTMTISENNNKTLTGTVPFLLTNNATISKAGTGTTTFTNVQLVNNADFNLDEGILSSSGFLGSITNTGMISLSGATLQTSNTFNHNAGSMIQGMGNITNSSTWNLNIDLEFPAGLLFGNSGTIQGDGNLVINNDFTFSGTIQGTGSFTVNGNTTWTAGTLDRTFTNPVGRTFTLSTTGLKTVSKSIVNTGTMLWQSGNISFNIANLSLTNEGTMTISENNNKTLTGTAPFFLTNNATISKTGTGTTTFTQVQLVSTPGSVLSGIGTISFSTGSTFSNDGEIQPGESPGILTINNAQPFSANSTLRIEVASNDGPGIGHDRLSSNINVTVNGALEVELINAFEPIAGDAYTILSYPSHTGSFITESSCWLVSYGVSGTTITYDPARFTPCVVDLVENNESMLCAKVIDYTVTVSGTPLPELSFMLSGATTGQGIGTGSGTTFNVGVTNVTIIADNGCSNDTCSFTVTIHDVEPPIADCPDDVTVNNDPGICGAVVNHNVTSDDNCQNEMISQTSGLPSGSTFPVGTTTNTFLVTDASGNTSVCSFMVTVIDNELPTITCPDDVTVNNDPGICGAVVNYNVTSDDNCPNEMISQTSGLPSGSTFPVGTTTNTFLVTDASGNTSVCSFTVTVVDNELPTITCPDDVTVNNDPGICGAVISYSVTSDDNCPNEMISQTSGLPSGSTFPVGTTTNTFLVMDASGNTAVCSMDVTVLDQEPPVALCQDITIQIPAESFLVVLPALIDQGSFDNCIIDTMTSSIDTLRCEDLGTHMVTLTIRDAVGLEHTCEATITLIDEIAVCIWPSAIVFVDSSKVEGVQTGFNWANAMLRLEDALAVAQEYENIEEIWIARGTYFPTQTMDREASFVLVSHIKLLGGFAGVLDDSSDRDVMAFETILSGDIGTPGDHMDNVYHVVTVASDVVGAVLDGLTVADGHANGLGLLQDVGGGILNQGELLLQNIMVKHCESTHPGSAIFNAGINARLELHSETVLWNE